MTVAMFHRVIDRDDPDFSEADPIYAMPSDVFVELLDFLNAHYRVVSLTEVLAAALDLRRLPDHALLITFDDGWADNRRYALPVLQRFGFPATIFVAAEAMLSPERVWWQEQVFAHHRRGTIISAIPAIVAASGPFTSGTIDPLECVCRLAAMDEPARRAILDLIPVSPPFRRMMLSPDDLLPLSAAGIAIGIHGYTHLPLTAVADIEAELKRARSCIGSLTGDDTNAHILSLPHGRYDKRVTEAARRSLIGLVFSSDPVLTRTQSGTLDPARPIGRIGLEASELIDSAGRFDPARAMTYLWRRPLA